jgi:electron transfer flavoprotein alpha subunit
MKTCQYERFEILTRGENVHGAKMLGNHSIHFGSNLDSDLVGFNHGYNVVRFHRVTNFGQPIHNCSLFMRDRTVVSVAKESIEKNKHENEENKNVQ